jgi:tRNA (guanine37-N1)-methyltransferase
MSFRASVLTLYPDMFPGTLGHSLAGRALENGVWDLDVTQIRDFAEGKHKNVDDTPSGGGAGMVLRADVVGRAIDSVSLTDDPRPRLMMSPRGKPLTQERVREIKDGPGVVIVCGRFEGLDQRVIDARDLEEVSIGDYILSGGEVAAQVLLDSVVRLLPGVMGNDISGETESFETGLLEHPHYTRPAIWAGLSIPDILSSGNHGKVEEWRRKQAEELTKERRPDLWQAYRNKNAAK